MPKDLPTLLRLGIGAVLAMNPMEQRVELAQ